MVIFKLSRSKGGTLSWEFSADAGSATTPDEGPAGESVGMVGASGGVLWGPGESTSTFLMIPAPSSLEKRALISTCDVNCGESVRFSQVKIGTLLVTSFHNLHFNNNLTFFPKYK